MRMLALTGALAASMLLSPGAVSQSAQDPQVNNPLALIFGGMFGIIAPTDPMPTARPNEVQTQNAVSQKDGERFVIQSKPDERGYVRTTVKGRAVLVDPTTRRIVEVLD
jgi:hypothetical protein